MRFNSLDMGVPTQQVKEFAPRLSFGCSISTPPFLALGLLDQDKLTRDLPETLATDGHLLLPCSPAKEPALFVQFPGFRESPWCA